MYIALTIDTLLSFHLYFADMYKLGLRIGEPMQICIHRKDNSSKPVNHRLTLKEGPKVKSNHIRRFPANDILWVGFTLQTSGINNKPSNKHFNVWLSLFDLEGGLKVKSDHIRRFPVHDFYKLVSHYQPLGPIISKL